MSWAFFRDIGRTFFDHNLLRGGGKFFGGTIPVNAVLPVYVSGGGIRHELYRSYLQKLSDSPSTSWTLEIESLGIPDSVEAPGIPAEARDRHAVAYGLCVDEQWLVNYPETIGDFTIRKRARSIDFISKEMV